MNLPKELQEQLLAMSNGAVPIRAKTVTIALIEFEGSGATILASAKVEEAVTSTGIALPSAQARPLPQSEMFSIITTFIGSALASLSGPQRPQAPQVQLVHGGNLN